MRKRVGLLAVLLVIGAVGSAAGAQAGDESSSWPLPPPESVIGATEREQASGRVVHPAPAAPEGLGVHDEELVELQQSAREAMGLDSDLDLVLTLMRSDTAIDDVREYGTVLTDEERDLLVRQREIESVVRPAIDELSRSSSYAGARVAQSEEPFLWDSVEVFVAADGFDEAAQVLADRDLPIPARVVPVRSSWSDLEETAEAIRDALNGDRDAVAPELATFLDLAEIELVGYSLVDNRVEISTHRPDAIGTSLELPRLPTVVYVEVEEGIEDGMCDKQGCSAPRAGIELEKNGSSLECTLGLPIRRTTTSNLDYTTADHCLTTAWDLQLPAWDTLVHSVDRRLGTYNSARPATTRVDADVIPTANHLVTNRLRALGNPGQRITGTRLYGSFLIGEDVCQSGAVTGAPCGEILDIGGGTTVGGFEVTDQVEADYTRSGGDSGAPVYSQSNPSIVYGWHHGASGGVSQFSSVAFIGDMQANTVVYTTTDRRRDWILKLYGAGLSRLPSAAEFNYWRNIVNGGSCDVQDARDTIRSIYLTSGEFESSHPLGSNPTVVESQRRQRVRLLYWGAYGRDSSPAEHVHWANIHQHHGWDDVVWSIIFNAEFETVYNSGGQSYDGSIC